MTLSAPPKGCRRARPRSPRAPPGSPRVPPGCPRAPPGVSQGDPREAPGGYQKRYQKRPQNDPENNSENRCENRSEKQVKTFGSFSSVIFDIKTHKLFTRFSLRFSHRFSLLFSGSFWGRFWYCFWYPRAPLVGRFWYPPGASLTPTWPIPRLAEDTNSNTQGNQGDANFQHPVPKDRSAGNHMAGLSSQIGQHTKTAAAAICHVL